MFLSVNGEKLPNSYSDLILTRQCVKSIMARVIVTNSTTKYSNVFNSF